MVTPSILEPLRQFSACIVIEDVDVQLSLMRKAGEGQITAAKVTDGWIYGIRSEQQIQFCVERMAQKQPDDDLLRFNLCGQSAKSRFVIISGYADRQLLLEFLDYLLLEANGDFLIDILV